MLPKLHRQRYQDLKQALEHLQLSTSGVVAVSKLQQFQATKQLFQQVLSLDANELEPDEEAQVRSYQTEIAKQLRLLEMDLMFLQAAKQLETVNQRQNQLSDRLVVLIGYCDVLLRSSSTL